MRIDEVNWITAHNYGEPKWHLFSPSLRWKGNFWASTLPRKMCPIENKLLIQICWSWYHFSQEKLLHTLIPVISSTYCGKYPVPFFFWATLYIPGNRCNLGFIKNANLRSCSDPSAVIRAASYGPDEAPHTVPEGSRKRSVQKKKENQYILFDLRQDWVYYITMITVKSCALTFMTR